MEFGRTCVWCLTDYPKSMSSSVLVCLFVCVVRYFVDGLSPIWLHKMNQSMCFVYVRSLMNFEVDSIFGLKVS